MIWGVLFSECFGSSLRTFGKYCRRCEQQVYQGAAAQESGESRRAGQEHGKTQSRWNQQKRKQEKKIKNSFRKFRIHFFYLLILH